MEQVQPSSKTVKCATARKPWGYLNNRTRLELSKDTRRVRAVHANVDPRDDRSHEQARFDIQGYLRSIPEVSEHQVSNSFLSGSSSSGNGDPHQQK